MAFRISSLSILLSSIGSASADRDGSYYPNGVANPALDNRMYWHDANAVLSDITEFDALYVKYHSCMWSEDLSSENDGGDDEDDTWYLGSVPSFRPNVAYSLYGVMVGERDRGCSKKTFINTFYTTNGLESFTNLLAVTGNNNFQYNGGEDGDSNDGNYGGETVTSSCYVAEEEGNDNDDNVANGNKYSSDSYSYGTGCLNGNFVLQSYMGQNCDPNFAQGVVDDLEDFNNNIIDGGKCVKLYDANEDVNDDDGGSDDMGQLALLQYSNTCNVRDPYKTCPDPFGLLEKNARNLEYAVNSVDKRPFFTETRVTRMTWSFFSLTFLTILGAITLIIYEFYRTEKLTDDVGSLKIPSKINIKKTRTRSKSRSKTKGRSRSNSGKKNTNNNDEDKIKSSQSGDNENSMIKHKIKRNKSKERNNTEKMVHGLVKTPSATEKQTATVSAATAPPKMEYIPPAIPVPEPESVVAESNDEKIEEVPARNLSNDISPSFTNEVPAHAAVLSKLSGISGATTEEFDEEHDLEKEAIEVVAMKKKKNRSMMKLFGKKK